MNRPFSWRAAGVVLCAALALLAAALFNRWDAPQPVRDPGFLFGVPILIDDQYAALSQSADPAVPGVLYNGQAAPLDEKSGTLYLSAAFSDDSRAGDLAGRLACEGGYTLAFAPDPRLDSIAQAAADNHAFTLLCIRGKTYTPLRAVITPLPVFSIFSAGAPDYSDPYAEHRGGVCVFEPASDTPQTSHASWHRRGMTTRLFKKGSWKLSLTNAFGKSRNLAIAGLGSDDDWILNSMGMDDLKLREKLIMDLWNGMETTHGMRMSAGEYAEVVVDGEYLGLYLLQRRVDVKYLGLDKSRHIVLKGSNLTYAPPTVQEAFTIKDSPLTAERTYALAQNYFSMDDLSALDLSSYLDMELFVLFGALYDNLSFRNAYCILSPQESTYRSYILPWDTDLAFGLRFVEGQGYVLLQDHETSLPFEHRREYDAMKALYPDLDKQLAARWEELRGGALSDDAIAEALGGAIETITASGAFARDRALWGTRYGEEDTFPALKDCIRNRLVQLDAMYMQ